MDARGLALLAYLPVPGLFLVPLYAAPGERLARFHAKQGGALVLAWYVALALVGFAMRVVGPVPALGALAAVVLVAGLAGMAVGAAAAARGRFVRIPLVWGALSASGTRRSPRRQAP